MRLTRRQALFIKSLRVNRGYTWRGVDGEFVSRYTFGRPFASEPLRGGNQVDGMYLCDAAMHKLKETNNNDWN
jgi:hypothetical protein